MRVAFMGTPQLAARILSGIAEVHVVALALTRPDAVSGRGNVRHPSPVKSWALANGIAVYESSSVDSQMIAALEDAQIDVICVAAYGCLLTKEVLELPRYGCLNVHMSLLPKWRGAAPIERALLAGEKHIGYSIMRMDEGLDTGDYGRQGYVAASGLYRSEIEGSLAVRATEALCATLDDVANDRAQWTSQDPAEASYAEKIGKSELFLNPAESVALNDARVRASSEAHPARAVIAGREVTIERVAPVTETALAHACAGLEPGEACFIRKRLVIGCSDGSLEVEQLRPSGKASMEGKAFSAGIRGFKDEKRSWEGLV